MAQEEYITASDAAAYLGTSYWKVWQLLKNNKLNFETDPLDERRKLIKRTDLDKLKARRSE